MRRWAPEAKIRVVDEVFGRRGEKCGCGAFGIANRIGLPNAEEPIICLCKFCLKFRHHLPESHCLSDRIGRQYSSAVIHHGSTHVI